MPWDEGPGGEVNLSGGWHHIAGVFSTTLGQALLFVDGSVVDTLEMDPFAESQDDLEIGCYEHNNHHYFKGSIDEVRYSSIVRYSANFTPEPSFVSDSDTILLFHFDEGSGNTAADSSPNGLDATIGGATWVTR
jgi:hypothetical protein